MQKDLVFKVYLQEIVYVFCWGAKSSFSGTLYSHEKLWVSIALINPRMAQFNS
jgi:hypothetical protein